MLKMEFLPNEIVILSDKAKQGLPMRVGERCIILEQMKSVTYDYRVGFDDGNIAPVKIDELIKLTEQDKQYMDYIFTKNKVRWNDEVVTVVKVDYLHKNAEIEFDDGSMVVVNFDGIKPLNIDSIEEEKLGKFGELGLEIGKFTDDKNKQYGSSVDATYEIMKVLLERYTYDEENYLIPQSLVRHILLQVRIMDKQNRIFNNPSGKDEKESPYKDITGYGLIGVDMVESK